MQFCLSRCSKDVQILTWLKMLCICADSDFQSHQRSEVIHFQWVCNLRWHKQTPKDIWDWTLKTFTTLVSFDLWKNTEPISANLASLWSVFQPNTFWLHLQLSEGEGGAMDGLCGWTMCTMYQHSNWTQCPPVCSDLIGFNSSWFTQTNSITHLHHDGLFQSMFCYHSPRQHYLHDNIIISWPTN